MAIPKTAALPLGYTPIDDILSIVRGGIASLFVKCNAFQALILIFFMIVLNPMAKNHFQAYKSSMELNQTFHPRYGRAVQLSPRVARLTAENPSPFTFHGTNTYLIGEKSLAIIDPGPALEAHIQSIIKAVDKRPVSHILVTHTHADHSPAAPFLTKYFNAPQYGEGPHRLSRALHLGEINPLDASADNKFTPDKSLQDGDILYGEDWTLDVIATPGHAANHLSFSLREENTLFSGDHVMAWSTSIVAPPDGSMSDFMASLEKLMSREEQFFLPGHGGRVENPAKFMRGLKTHRLMREAAIVERIKAGDRTIADMVKVLYATTNPNLHGAAALSVLAHLEDLVLRETVKTENTPTLDGLYFPNS